MGFLDFVGNALSCIGRTVTTAFKGCCSAIGSIGKTAFEFLRAPTVGIFKCISSAVSFVAETLGIKKPEETPEELGDRAMQGKEIDIVPEKYNSTKEYIQALREKTSFDHKAFEELSDEEKFERESLGTSIYTKGVEEDLNIKLPVEFLFDIGKLGLTGAQLKLFTEIFIKNGFSTMLPMSQYLHGTLEPDKVFKTGASMKEATEKMDPTLSRDEINKKILEAQELIRKS